VGSRGAIVQHVRTRAAIRRANTHSRCGSCEGRAGSISSGHHFYPLVLASIITIAMVDDRHGGARGDGDPPGGG
jgi:hypothetical protein